MTASSQLNELRTSHVSSGIKTLHPVYVDRAENARVWDTDGKEYIDMSIMGIGIDYQQVIKGLVLLGAVSIDQYYRKR